VEWVITYFNISLGPFVKEIKNQNLYKGVHVLHGVSKTMWNDQQHYKDMLDGYQYLIKEK
jgi:hypothetical protein